jgi:putative addiction module component (TIGR02574 family)
MMNAKEVIDEAISLPVEERALIADSLLRSLNRPEKEMDKEWTGVARRRLDEIRSGTVKCVAGDAVFERIWKRFHE